MKPVRLVPVIALLALLLGSGIASAKVDTVDLYSNAVITGDVPVLEKVLAPNFWYIGANGHIRDKEHFIAEIRDKKLVIDRLSLSNMRETKVGDTRLLTFNGEFHGKSDMPLPHGLMRYTLVLAENNDVEQVVLFQATPVIPTAECKDGNCRIR